MGRPKNNAENAENVETIQPAPKRQMRSLQRAEIKTRGEKYVPIQDVDTSGNGIDYYDKCLITVQRMNNGSYGITRGITIREIIQTKIPGVQSTMDALNMSGDWQNETIDGMPVCIFYFLHGSVEIGEKFAANDIYHKMVNPADEDGEEYTADPKEAVTIHGKPKIAKWEVHERRIEKWISGKNGNPYGKAVFAEE